MTAPEHNRPDRNADRLAREWIDDEPHPARDTETPADHEPFTAERRRQAAGQGLVHSLLTGLYDRDQVGRERRIQDVMQRIRTEQQPDAPSINVTARRRSRVVRWGAAAAAAVVLAAMLIPFTQSDPALATLDKMIAAADGAGDRTYSIHLRDPGRRGRRRPPAGAGPAGVHRKATLDGATLHFRGRDKFVLIRPSAPGRRVIDGFDGQQSWLVRPRKPVLVSDDPTRFRIPMPEELSAVLSLDVRATLKRLRDEYDIEHLDPDALNDGPDSPAWTHLRASRRDRGGRGPKVIKLWSHPETGLLRRIVFENVKVQSQRTPRHVIIDLVNQKSLPADWFTHDAHHPGDATVELVTETP